MNAPTFPRPRPPGHERELHASVAAYLRPWLCDRRRCGRLSRAAGGGLERGKMLARLGLRPGIPDVLVWHPAPTALEGCRSVILVGLELKTEIGRQSVVQRAVEADFTAAGGAYCLCRSIDDVEMALVSAGIPLFAAAGGRR